LFINLNRSRYYDEMGDQDRNRQFGRHRGRSRNPEHRDDRGQSRTQSIRRPGEYYAGQPSTSHSIPYPSPLIRRNSSTESFIRVR
jgi:hypothetical protein